ncbi:hypothetical protein [Psychromicrobium xiongbiense]|uniref:hypothetical protein n=1 Tax=Psychromicrobium xiongbiense TaxID=3051184 RepID=UPI0025526337|nr:hypothetical protein [Psychromicrobium sp. YIM S02556]
MTDAPVDPRQPRTFPFVWSVWDTVSQIVVGTILMLVAGVLLWFLLTLPFILWLKLPLETSRLYAAGIVLVIVAILVFFKVRMLIRSVKGTSLTVDARGITAREPHATRFIAWQDLVAATKVPNIGPYRTPQRRRAINAANVLAASHPLGLIGHGVLALDVDASGLVKAQYEQHRTLWGIDEASGIPWQGINPSRSASGRWDESEFGAWLRHFRPDIWQQAHDQFSPSTTKAE